ncbi:MAG: 50S ribosomal protein L28 [Candidatus Midichloria sp.]|nr:MAG: 50S ribosomal protein L28 [Candidatus Midichloria sp.]
MSRICNINGSKAVMSGNNVSHSNHKTRRRFLPNIQNFALWSDTLNRVVRLDMTASGARTIEHNNGIDNYLLSTSNSKLTKAALLIKKQIKSAIAKKNLKLSA